MEEFIRECKQQNTVNVEDVTSASIRKYLAKMPKKQMPGAWRSRYTAIKTFFNYLVFVGMLDRAYNPMATTPTGESLTNKRMLTQLELGRLLLSIPQTHRGTQDKICCHLLWDGYSLRHINQLTVNNIPNLPTPVKKLVQPAPRNHIAEQSLFVTQNGEAQFIHGQKLNRRLQKYAVQAGLPDGDRLTASLIYQSGVYFRLANPNVKGGHSRENGICDF